ncbi:agmatine deiminase family protein [Kitasatospora sp. NPDC051853]|uniref:agmatine deiminase family protein n=1 Tax=Kitasatospora sp. NPDC051853 TaxID=3364058 RepID=UPI003792141F
MREPALTRRTLLRSGSVLAAIALLDGCSSADGDEGSEPSASPSAAPSPTPSPSASASAVPLAMPSESRRHTRTFMAWPALEEVWGADLPAVRQDIARVAQAVARFEPVVLMARPEQSAAARQLCGSSVEVIDLAVDDLWARDTGPTFVTGGGALAGVDLNFNGWGNKQTHTNDSQVARRVLERYSVRRIEAPITGEGGGIEVDGEGTLMATESSWVNPNRNPGRSRDQIEASFKELFGVRKVLWFTGVAGQDITDCHVDALARFAEPGVVVLHRPGPDAEPDIWSRASDQALQVLKEATDANGRRLRIVELVEPDMSGQPDRGKDFLATYLNYYVVNGAVIMPRFGDKTSDDRAAGILGDLHPGRQVVPVEINAIAAGGGGIHCSTQQQPEAASAPPPVR